MSYEFLQILWFILIAVLWIGFHFLEGFDFGVGMLLPFLGKKDEERRAIINSIGSVWDGNEVWLLTAGGATFAAFPHWYATMFSGFYLALFLLLVGLILRGIAFEYRSKDASPKWRNTFDWMIAIGSFLASVLLGAAFANLARGVPIDENMMFTGNLFTLLNPYGLLGGVTTTAIFLLHGANFLGLKLEGELRERVIFFAKKLWAVATVVYIALGIFTYVAGNSVFSRYLLMPYIPGAGELTVFCGALAGAGLGFLWFNAYPAEVFMGDVGALALGVVAVVARQEIVLFIMGGVFVAETVSVMVQVGYFKYTKKRYGEGRRILLMAPLHHHFEQTGWKETQVVVRFWIITILLVLFGLSTLKIR